MSNCLFEGAYEEILYRCNCTPSFHQTGIKEYPVICTGTKLKCMKYILQRIGKYNEVSYPIRQFWFIKATIHTYKIQGGISYR